MWHFVPYFHLVVCFQGSSTCCTMYQYSIPFYNWITLYWPHSSTLAWKIPWMEEPGGLQSTGSLRVGHDWATSYSLSCIGEGNGNPLQCSCLENPRDGGAWCTAIYGVAQNQTQLKQLSSSSRPLYLLLWAGIPRRHRVAIIVNKRVWNAVLGCSLKNDRMISVHFQGKPFNITVIQVYALTSNAEEAEVEHFYEDLQDLLELTVKRDVLSL